MNPYPLVGLNHFTVPVGTWSLLKAERGRSLSEIRLRSQPVGGFFFLALPVSGAPGRGGPTSLRGLFPGRGVGLGAGLELQLGQFLAGAVAFAEQLIAAGAVLR